MKLLIASDLHSSVIAGNALKEIFEKGNFDKLIILGDFLYHGPRNPIPSGYSPMELAAVLNSMKDKIIAVRGNCDAEVDQMVLEFPITDAYKEIEVDGKKFFLTHGHVFNAMDMLGKCDVFLSGHTHVPVLEKTNPTVIANPGSTTIPKGCYEASYMTYEDGVIKLFSLADSKELERLDI